VNPFLRPIALCGLLFALGSLVPPALWAEEGDGSYLIPRTVFVGDRGQLVVPLGTIGIGGSRAEVQEPSEGFSQSQDFIITRIELDSRGVNPRLLVDFQAFVPGVITFPPIVIGGLRFTDLTVTIASILDVQENSLGLVLSEAAPLLAAPGTSALIYGTVTGIILVLLALGAGGIWGIPGLKRYRARLRRRRMIRSMNRIIAGLRRDLAEKAGDGKAALTRFSVEFRAFLETMSRKNCRAMIPGEFRAFPVRDLFDDDTGTDAVPGPQDADGVLTGAFLCDLFSRCDALRFSGFPVTADAAGELLDRAADFTRLLEQTGGTA
jgi:hypothetical protein